MEMGSGEVKTVAEGVESIVDLSVRLKKTCRVKQVEIHSVHGGFNSVYKKEKNVSVQEDLESMAGSVDAREKRWAGKTMRGKNTEKTKSPCRVVCVAAQKSNNVFSKAHPFLKGAIRGTCSMIRSILLPPHVELRAFSRLRKTDCCSHCCRRFVGFLVRRRGVCVWCTQQCDCYDTRALPRILEYGVCKQ